MGKITIRQPQVKVTVYLNDTSHFARYNSVYAQRFPQPNCDFSFSFAQKRAPPMPSVPRLGPSLDDAHLFDCRSCPHCELVDSPGRALLAGTGSDPGRRSLLLPLAQGASGLHPIQRTEGDCARVTTLLRNGASCLLLDALDDWTRQRLTCQSLDSDVLANKKVHRLDLRLACQKNAD